MKNSSRSSSSLSKNKTTKAKQIHDIEELGNNFSFSQDQITRLRSNLLHWYDKNHRRLPWRVESGEKITDKQRGYRVWISEIMLQQTQVKTVIDYFNQWMKKFPTVEDLAKASGDEVHEMWSGLGYYTRARNIHKCAQVLVNQYNGTLPKEAPELEKLPGIGKYTAGAISSIAYDKCYPLVDGNVIRVFSRLLAMDKDPKATTVNKHIWNIADVLVDRNRPGDFNQSLMELGATVCTPKNPVCNSCPIREECRAHQYAKDSQIPSVEVYPVKSSKKAKREETAYVTVVKRKTIRKEVFDDDGIKNEMSDDENKNENENDTDMDSYEFLVVQRPSTGLLANLWEFPNIVFVNETNNNNNNNNNNSKKNNNNDHNTNSDNINTSQQTNQSNSKQFKEENNNNSTKTKPNQNSNRFSSMKEMLVNRFSFQSDCLDYIEECGSVTHVFSHIRQQLLVHTVDLSSVTHQAIKQESQQDNVSSTEQSNETNVERTRWLTETQLQDAALSTQMRKVFRCYLKHKNQSKRSKPGKKSKKRSRSLDNDNDDDSQQRNDQHQKKRQKTLKSFFS